MTGLVLEGGAFRGLFTAGVLDALLDIKAEIKYVIGVSAGATNAYSYVSKQRGRNLEIMERFMNNKRYISYGNLIRCKSLMDLDFVFDIMNNLIIARVRRQWKSNYNKTNNKYGYK